MTNRDNGHEPETIIAAGVKVEGDFTSQGDVLIEGTVEGSLHTERDLRVGERASIDASVSAANAVVAGTVKGNMVVHEKLELQATAHVYGDVQTKVLIVSEGATVSGRIVMDEAASANERSTKATLKTDYEKTKSKVVVLDHHDDEVVQPEKEKVKEKRVLNAFFAA